MLGNHLVLFSISSHFPVKGQIPSFEAFILISQNWKKVYKKLDVNTLILKLNKLRRDGMKLYYGISFCAHELEMNYLCNERVEKLGQRTPINFSWFVRSKPGNVCSTRLPNISLYSGPHTCIGHIGSKCQSEMYLQYLATLVIYIHLPSLLLFIPQHKDSFGISQGNANSPKPSLKLQLALPTSSMHLTALKF